MTRLLRAAAAPLAIVLALATEAPAQSQSAPVYVQQRRGGGAHARVAACGTTSTTIISPTAAGGDSGNILTVLFFNWSDTDIYVAPYETCIRSWVSGPNSYEPLAAVVPKLQNNVPGTFSEPYPANNTHWCCITKTGSDKLLTWYQVNSRPFATPTAVPSPTPSPSPTPE